MPRHNTAEVRESILEFLATYIEEHGIAPTMQEMADAVGRSRRSLHDHLVALAQAERITYTPRPGRGNSRQVALR